MNPYKTSDLHMKYDMFSNLSQIYLKLVKKQQKDVSALKEKQAKVTEGFCLLDFIELIMNTLCVSQTLKPVGQENWRRGYKDRGENNPASYFRPTSHCRAPTALKWTGLLLNMIKRNQRWRSSSRKATGKWGECDVRFSLHSCAFLFMLFVVV